jgi:flagellar export protein FliJ
MARFVFRAEAALDLRRRQEELAQRAQAEAAAAFERAQAAAAAAERAWRDSLASSTHVHDPAQREWHRNWSLRQRQDLARKQAMVNDRRAALDAATKRLNLAHRDVRALERLRERAQAAWLAAERRAEQKELDWLGSMRHALGSPGIRRDR